MLMVATTIDQCFHLAPQQHDQYCSAMFNALLHIFCSYSIHGNSQIKDLLRKMKDTARASRGRHHSGDHPPWRAKDPETLKLLVTIILIVTIINIASVF